MRDAYAGLSAREQIDLKFTETYHLAYLIDAMLDRSDFYINAEFSDYHAEAGHLYAEPFDQWTALHKFVGLVASLVIDSNFTKASRKQYVRANECSGWMCQASSPHLLAEVLLRSHNVGTGDISTQLRRWVVADCRDCPQPTDSEGPEWDQIWEDLLIVEDIETAIENLSEEVFFVLFANRTFLYKFNRFMSTWLQWIDPENPRLRKDRSCPLVLKRAAIPGWARQAVFFRDRGRCCKCGVSLAPTYTAVNRKAFDHIVPLADGGLNDVTNLQLLCRGCNRDKGSAAVPPSSVYERWFEVQRPNRR